MENCCNCKIIQKTIKRRLRKMNGFAELTMDEMNSVEGGLLLELAGIIYAAYKLYDYYNDTYERTTPKPEGSFCQP